MGAVAKSYVTKGFLIYEEMRKYLTIYEEVVSYTVYDFACNRSLLNFLLYEENSIFFISAVFCESWQGIEERENEAVSLVVNKLKHYCTVYITCLVFFPLILHTEIERFF
jgi:hypothetical protein